MRLFTLAAVAIIVALAACSTPSPKAMPDTFTIMTFNIRYDTPRDGINAWPKRKEAVAALIRREAPAVFGIQEGLLHQVEYLESVLSNYAWVGVGRDDGKLKGEFTAVFVDSTRLNLIDSGTFWMSKTPNKPSKGWDAALNRTTTWVDVKPRSGKQRFFVFNTHYDHRGDTAKAESSLLIRQKMREIAADYPALLIGDFNSIPGSIPFENLIQIQDEARNFSSLILGGGLNGEQRSGPAGTFQAFDPAKLIDHPIDFIFATPGVSLSNYRHITDTYADTLYPSDHFPVAAEVTF